MADNPESNVRFMAIIDNVKHSTMQYIVPDCFLYHSIHERYKSLMKVSDAQS